MRYYFIKPEVAGHRGDKTVVLDDTVFPQIVSKLHYEFDGWPEDVLATSFGAYVLKRNAKPQLEAIRPTGVEFDKVQVTKSEEFRYFFPRRNLPEYVWLRITGKAGHNDFGMDQGRRVRLVVSQRVLILLVKLGISHATIEDYTEGTSGRKPAPAEGWRPKYPVNPETGQTMKVHEVVSIKGRKYIVRACDYTTGKPEYLEAERPRAKT